MQRKNKTYGFLFENTSVVTPSEIEILEESKTQDGKPKLAFKSRLQESGVKNANKRIYSDSICESIVEQLSPKAQSRNLLMEIDHPMFFSGSTDPIKAKQRAGIIEVKNCAAAIKNIKYDNNQVIGEIETLSGFHGPDLANLITKDKINIGFSLRALGSVEPMQDGTLMVKAPIMPITYDIVSNPSHSNSRIVEFLPETDMGLLQHSESVLCENADDLDLLKEDQIYMCEGDVCVRKFIKDIIAEHFSTLITKIQFRI